jgi:hypothetical protein
MPFTPAALRFFDARCCLTRIRLQLAIYFCVHRGSLNQNAARWQASLRSIKPRPNSDRGFVCAVIWLSSTLLGLPRQLDKFSPPPSRSFGAYRLASLNRNRAAVLVSCFCLSFLPPFCCVGTAQIFTCLFFPLFAFFPAGVKQWEIVKLVESPKCLPRETRIESPLANGYLVMNKIALKQGRTLHINDSIRPQFCFVS